MSSWSADIPPSVTDRLNPRAADRLARAARAAHTLSETLWEAVHEELASPAGGERVAELSRRLADTAAAVSLLAQGGDPGVPGAPDRAAGSATPSEPVASAHAVERAHAVEPQRSEPPTAMREGLRAAAMLVDELAPEEAEAGSESEIHVRDQRGMEVRAGSVPAEADEAETTSPWIASIARRVERYERDREPFAVLVVELIHIERLRHAELPGEVARLTGLVETALAGELRPVDSLMRESPGRYWLLAGETDPEGARALAGRLAGAVSDAAEHRGEPLRIAAGIAACPSDGLAAGALAAHADIGLYAARAAGRPLV